MSIRNPIHWIGEKPADFYACIPNDLARDGELSSVARSVALLFWSHTENWELSAVSMAAALGLNRETVGDALEDLSERRWIAVRKTGRTSREYYAHPARRLTEDEHAEFGRDGKTGNACRINRQGDVGNSSKGMSEIPATPMPEIPATKNLNPENQQEEQQELRDGIDARNKTMAKLLDDLTVQFLAAYPKPGSFSPVRDALCLDLNAHGGVGHFPVLLAYTEAYTQQRQGQDRKYTKSPQNFLRDNWYREHVEIPKTPAQLWQDSYDAADLSYPVNVKGLCYSRYTAYPDNVTTDSSRPNDYSTWSKPDRDEWDFHNKRRFVAQWAKTMDKVEMSSDTEPVSILNSREFHNVQ